MELHPQIAALHFVSNNSCSAPENKTLEDDATNASLPHMNGYINAHESSRQNQLQPAPGPTTGQGKIRIHICQNPQTTFESHKPIIKD
jgi:hypothetical protein